MDEPTLQVGQLLRSVKSLLDEALPRSLWVEGEVRGLTRSRAGHVYFDLVDPDDDPKRPEAALPVALFASDRRRVEAALQEADASPLADGLQVRARGQVSLYVARSQVQLVMRAVDPAFTVGRLEAARRRLLATLEAEGLLRAQAGLVAPTLVRRLALVTSAGSAACADALHELERSDLGWDVLLVDTVVQGAGAEVEVARAVEVAAELAPIVLVVRGGGSRSDLATFDAEVVARAIAGAPVPVWTGIGHEIDRSVADEVAHRALKTPTACAAALVEHVRGDLERVHAAWQGIERRTGRALADAAERLRTRAHHLDRSTTLRLRAEQRQLEQRRADLPALAHRRLEAAAHRLDGAEARVRASDPARRLAQGWSITTDGDGRTLRRIADAPPGTEVRTRLADGELRSTVSTTHALEATDDR